jgi:hypothetical protein
MAALAGVAMIAAGLTWMFGPWGLIGPGLFLMVGMPVFMNERPEKKEKTDA